MKIPVIFFAVALSLSSTALAGFKLPSKVFGIEKLEDAKKEASVKGKPLSILYSDKNSTCPLCDAASAIMMKELGTKTIMVYVSDINSLPRTVKEAFKAGRFIPKIAVFDDSLEESLGSVTYEAVKENSRTAFRSVEKAIREYKKLEQ